MKKILVLLTAFSVGLIAHGQKITNAPGSEYQFTEIARHDATPVLSQGYTGTCWSFSALSFFESEMIRKGVENPPILSQMYVARKAYEGKAENYIRMGGKSNFSQGGAFHDIPYVFKRYGMVPNEVYTGLNYGTEKHNHQELFKGLNGYMGGILDYVQNKKSAKLSKNWKDGLNGILDAYFGEDPTKFTYEGKEYTPRSFAESTKLDMDEYVSLTSFTHLPMHEEVQLMIQDNWAWGKSYNVTMDELLDATISALENGYTVAWASDVSEKGFDFRKGLAIVPEDENTIKVRGKDNQNFSDAGATKESDAFLTPVKEITVTPEMRQEGYDNKTTTDDHGMHITGLYEEANGTRYFLVKNSWGKGNYPEGYLYVSENYFKLKTINVYLHKDGVPKRISKKIMK
ncbi:aminopeptidase [Brumimicrobium salinarum]|uniref:Aminopeptidase n=1 Tax=Brumimicrobium salinarum TaxID=2058658 RepID=A0A2I0R5M7_9FLAO|nr:C1 family peptidase [Brumimicrobium salinarum]PKR81875.1 aminopeptidase [Brumimicrobium salinarum]